MDKHIYIKTPRLLLRNWTENDIEHLYQMNSDKDVMHYFPSPLTREKNLDYYHKLKKHVDVHGFGFFAVENIMTQDFVGLVGCANVPFNAFFTPAIEIGWRLKKVSWGFGYATEAAEHCQKYMQERGIKEIVSFTSVKNKPSQRVMQRIGMNFTDFFQHPMLPKNHKLSRHVLYKKLLS